jgi:hypothetical protein
MNRRKTWSLIILVSLLILGFTVVRAAPHQAIDWYVIAGGGGSDSSGELSLDGTLGQAFSGEDGAGTAGLCAGFWCQVLPRPRLLLPFVARRGP